MNKTVRYINPGDFFILSARGEKVYVYRKVYRDKEVEENECLRFSLPNPSNVDIIWLPDDTEVTRVMGRIDVQFSVISV